MRRTLAAAIGTILGLVMLLSFKSTGSSSGRLASLGSGQVVASAPGPTVAPTAKAAGAAPHVASAAPAPVSRTVNGQAIDTRYGPVQLQVTLLGSRIVRIVPLQLPSGQSRDDQINRYAIPILNQEALQAQSARIDAVSGATFTSDGYARSLQSALDQAHA